MERIVVVAKELYKVTRADVDNRRHMDDLLLKQGFSFDVFYDEEHDKCELVEERVRNLERLRILPVPLGR